MSREIQIQASDLTEFLKPENAIWHTYASSVGGGINKKFQVQVGNKMFRVLNSASGKNEVEYEGFNSDIAINVYNNIVRIRI